MIQASEARANVKEYNRRMDYVVIGKALSRIEDGIEKRSQQGERNVRLISGSLGDERPHRDEFKFIFRELNDAGYTITFEAPRNGGNGVYKGNDVCISW